MPRRSLAMLLLVALGGWEPFWSPDPDVQAGNRAYAEGRYDDAVKSYDKAAKRTDVDRHGLAFDRGTALLKQAQGTQDPAQKAQLMARALEDLKEAAKSKDARLRADAHYNRGNAALGEHTATKPEQLGEAIEAYKDALRANPSHENARMNLELALRKREKQQQQQQQGGQGQGQGQQGQGQGQQGQGQQGQGQGQGSGQGQQGQGQQGQGQGQGQGSQQPQQGQGQGQGSQQPQQGQGSQDQQQGQGSQQPQQGQGSQDQQQGQGSQDQQGQQGQGQGSQQQQQPQQGQQGQGQGQPQNPNDPSATGPVRPNQGRTAPKSPESPADQKLDDLETFSRRLQRDGARKRASGRSRDPAKDW